MNKRFAITGFMGAGKTSVAMKLARALGVRLIDLDSQIEASEGRAVASIIDHDGEARFREIEAEALEIALAAHDDFVIAPGGGAWASERNRALIESHGCISVWLDAPFELCWQRIERGGAQRPLARDKAKARDLFGSRRPAYSLARIHITVTAEMAATEIAQRIIAAARDDIS